MTDRRSIRALSIIEVIVVLCILVVLAMMILPTAQGPRRSLLASCLSNQRQIVLGAILYKDDIRDGFPNLDDSSGNDGPVALALTTNYLKKPEIFMCPFVVKQGEDNRPWYREEFVPELNTAFFGSNGNDYAYYDGVKSVSPTNALLTDRLAWTNRALTSNALFHARGRLNVVFSDGHGEILSHDRVVGNDYVPPWSAVQDPLLRR